MPLKTLGPIGPRAVGERVKYSKKYCNYHRLGSGTLCTYHKSGAAHSHLKPNLALEQGLDFKNVLFYFIQSF
jgi:hypothetical protein